MPKNQSFSTYAVTLYFDDATTMQIRKLMADFAYVTGNDFMTANDVPPHLTLGMEFLKKVAFNRNASIISIGLAQCNPYTRLLDIDFQ